MNSMNEWFESIYSMRPVEIRDIFPYLGNGISRTVYAISNFYVAKIAANLDGFDQCSMEAEIYKNSSKKYKSYLCPILWYKPGMVVMPRAVPVTNISSSPVFNISILGKDAFPDLKHLAHKYDLLFEDIESSSSWGILMGRTVLIDYGCTN